MVAGPLDKGSIPEIWELKEGVTEYPYEWGKIKKSAEEVILIYSDNDAYDCGQRHGKVIQAKVGGKLIIKKGQGHFNLEVSENYREFPELLDLI